MLRLYGQSGDPERCRRMEGQGFSLVVFFSKPKLELERPDPFPRDPLEKYISWTHVINNSNLEELKEFELKGNHLNVD